MIFSSLPFHGIPPHAAANCSHTLFFLSSPGSLSTNGPAYSDSSIESHHIPSVVFTRVCHPRFRSADFFCSLSSSFVFRCLRRRHSPSNRTLFSNQSSLPLVPFPATGGPGDSNNMNDVVGTDVILDCTVHRCERKGQLYIHHSRYSREHNIHHSRNLKPRIWLMPTGETFPIAPNTTQTTALVVLCTSRADSGSRHHWTRRTRARSARAQH